MDRKLNGRGVLNQLRKLTFPGAGPTVVSPPGDEGTHGKRDKGLTPPLKDRDIYLVARLNTSNEVRHAEVARHGFCPI